MNYFERLATYIQAIRGNSDAQFRIASYMMANDDPDSKDRAILWYQNSAKQGHTDACLYLVKHSIRTNNTENAIKYLRLSIPSSDGMQESLLGQILLNAYTTFIDQKKLKKGSLKPVTELDRYITSLYPNVDIGKNIHINESNVQENLYEALIYLNEGMEKNNPLALHALAIYTLEYKNSTDKQDEKIALSWLHQAAEVNFAPSLQALAGMYENGLFGLKADISKGLDLRIKAAATGSKEAQYALGMLVYRGNGFKQDREKGIELFEMAAKQGHREAIDFLKTIKTTV